MGKVTITEAKLTQLIKECVKRALNEIGDTPQGRAALANAADKAWNYGRKKQERTFLNGLTNIMKEKFGEGATYNTYQYLNKWGKRITLCANGQVTISDADGNNKSTYSIPNLVLRGKSHELKTTDLRVARQLAKWCAERMGERTYYEWLCDWHTFAAQ